MLFGVVDVLFGRDRSLLRPAGAQRKLPRRPLLQPQPPRLVRLAVKVGNEKILKTLPNCGSTA